MGDLLNASLDNLVQDIPETIINSGDALAVVALSAAASDGSVSSEERLRFVALALGSPLFPNCIDSIISKASALIHFISKIGPGKAMLSASLLLSRQLKETAFAWAVDIVMSDGRIDEKEKTYLQRIVAEFNIDDETAKQIIDVITIKNRTK
jgi:tellurite resistance protein